jgi:hypothetical protein
VLLTLCFQESNLFSLLIHDLKVTFEQKVHFRKLNYKLILKFLNWFVLALKK